MADILIVDDDPDIARLVELVLSRESHDCEVVTHADAALARLAGDPTDLVVLDVKLRDADGAEVLEALRDRHAWRHTPVLVLSAFPGHERDGRALASAADAYLTKPFTLDELRAVVKQLLVGRAVARSHR